MVSRKDAERAFKILKDFNEQNGVVYENIKLHQQIFNSCDVNQSTLDTYFKN